MPTRSITAEDLKRLLGLVPLEPEGGFYAESYRSPLRFVPGGTASARRPLATGIYYLLTPETFSEMHRLRSDELYHFYLGDPVEMLQLGSTGGHTLVLGHDVAAGERLQALVPAGVWQGSRLRRGGAFALLGTTMAPGFDPADYERGRRDELVVRWPEHRERIVELTRA